MRSKHLSMRKFIDRKPDKIKGIVCICIILAVVCAGNMIPNYLISLKAAKIAKTSTTISNADISPYSSSISAEERLTKMMSLMQDNVNELWNGKYSEKREPLDTEIPVGQAYKVIQTFLKGACELQKQSAITQMLGEDDIDMLQSLESNYSKDTDSEKEQTYEAPAEQFVEAGVSDAGFDNTISDFFVTSDISKELSAWVFIISFEDTRMLTAVDAVLGVPFYITYYCADVDSPKAQAAVMRDLYVKTYGSDYSMGDPKESESKIDSSFETNIIENFYYGNNYVEEDDEYTGFEPYVYSCSSDTLQMEYQVITRFQRFEKKGKQVSSYKSRVNICLY
ncbi:hypothetical protein [Agathobacter sp.]